MTIQMYLREVAVREDHERAARVIGDAEKAKEGRKELEDYIARYFPEFWRHIVDDITEVVIYKYKLSAGASKLYEHVALVLEEEYVTYLVQYPCFNELYFQEYRGSQAIYTANDDRWSLRVNEACTDDNDKQWGKLVTSAIIDIKATQYRRGRGYD